jgi:hypothetical protein
MSGIDYITTKSPVRQHMSQYWCLNSAYIELHKQRSLEQHMNWRATKQFHNQTMSFHFQETARGKSRPSLVF